MDNDTDRDTAPVDLLQAFTSYDGNKRVLKDLRRIFKKHGDPAVAVLALEGLYRIESDVDSGQFLDLDGRIRHLLRRWRCEDPLDQAYEGAFKRVPKFLRSLTIFKTLEVPLFIDDYGTKELLSNYTSIEDIEIDLNTPIFHVTHKEEAQKIVDEKRLKPSDAKNIIEGCWFGLDSPGSVYGSKSFKTTLSKLDVTGLHQGEIVSYKQEVNVILYAGDDPPFKHLKKPTDEAVREGNPEAYVNVSIFVPSRFLPSEENFREVFSGPFDVEHGPFCVRAKRLRSTCEELEHAKMRARLRDL